MVTLRVRCLVNTMDRLAEILREEVKSMREAAEAQTFFYSQYLTTNIKSMP